MSFPHWHKTSVVARLCVLGAVLGRPALSQSARLPEVGMRVRIMVPGCAPQGACRTRPMVTGRLVRLDGDTAVITDTAGPSRPVITRVALDDSHRLEGLVAHRDHVGPAAALGVFAGAIAGAIIATNSSRPCRGLACLNIQPSPTFIGAIVGAGGGAAVGVVVGSLWRSNTWAPLKATGVHVSVMPRAIGVSVAL